MLGVCLQLLSVSTVALLGILTWHSLHLAKVNLPRGFAYVEYATKEEAEAARDHMDAAQVDGNVIS